ncbi:unnamed protein product, partial [Prorocentrum cordatum]
DNRMVQAGTQTRTNGLTRPGDPITSTGLLLRDASQRPNARSATFEAFVESVNRHLQCRRARHVNPADPAVDRDRREVVKLMKDIRMEQVDLTVAQWTPVPHLALDANDTP